MLTKCPECGHDVSTNAKKCPNCGAPIESREEQGKENRTFEERTANVKKAPKEAENEIWTKMWHGGIYGRQEPKKICTECGYVGYPVSITPGTFLTEVALWCLFLLPGLIYSMWRLSGRHAGCPKCGGKMIALSSPRGKKLYEELEEEIYPETSSYKNKILSNDKNISHQKEQFNRITNRTERILDKNDEIAQESSENWFKKLCRKFWNF